MPKGKRWGWFKKWFQPAEPIPEIVEEPEEDVTIRIGTTFAPTEDGLVVSAGSEYNGLTPDYYISTTGSNSNDGLTPATAWAITALHGQTKTTELEGGAVVGILDGSYSIARGEQDSSWGGQPYNVGLAMKDNGTSGTPLKIVAQTPRGVTLSPGSGVDQTDGGYGLVIRLNADYVQFINLVFGAGTIWGQIQCFGDDMRVEGCDFEYVTATWLGNDNCGQITFTLKGLTTIKRPYITNCRFQGISNGADWNAVCVFLFSVENMVIEYCTWTGGNLFWTKYDWKNFTFRYNHVYSAGQAPYLSRSDGDTDTSYIHHNLIHERWGGSGFEADEGAPNVEIYNNTFVAPGTWEGFLWLRRKVGDATRACKSYNNIFYLTSNMQSQMQCAYNFPDADYEEILSLSDYNCFSNRNSNEFRITEGNVYSPTQTWSSLSAWTSATGFDTNSQQADPVFVGSDESVPEDWKLDTGSPCLNQGKTGGTSGGDTVHQGCWDGTVSQIGHSW